MKIAADLHIHSTLSPCASLEMSPAAIVHRARELALDLIAVTDHNSIENGIIAARLGEASGIRVLFGMEAQTREDVHILCLFDDRRRAEMFNELVYDLLPDTPNNPEFFGDQVVVDEHDDIVRHEKKLLLNALHISIPDLLELVCRHDGAAIPAHVEAPPYGLMVNLGVVPAELEDSIMEISYASPLGRVVKAFPGLKHHQLISNSDAHYLKDIGRARILFESPASSLADMVASLREGAFQLVYRGSNG